MTREIILAILAGGGVGVALIGLMRDWLAFRRERKARKEDAQYESEMKRLTELEKQSKAQGEAIKYLLYDRIRFLGQAYIGEKEVDFDDRRILKDMHTVYHNGLGGNGDLDVLMRQVDNLPLKIKK